MFLNQKWAEMRQEDFETITSRGASRVMPVTVRTLESLIRLATAHAKCRISKKIEVRDCKVAYDLIKYTLFGDDEDETEGQSRTGDNSDGRMEEENIPAQNNNNRR